VVLLSQQNLAVTADIELADNVTGALVDLNAATAITQSGGIVTASELVARAGGAIDLQMQNDLGTVAAVTSAAGTIKNRGQGHADCGSVTADDATTVDGITSNLASGDDIYVTGR